MYEKLVNGSYRHDVYFFSLNDIYNKNNKKDIGNNINNNLRYIYIIYNL